MKFECARCGTCCTWPGYVKISGDDVSVMSTLLGMDVAEFTARFADLTSSRKGLKLKEKENGECIFYDAGEKSCGIYLARPEQCRNFPLKWNFKGWEEECGGIVDSGIGDRRTAEDA